MIISLVRPVLLSFVTSRKVKKLVVDLLEAAAKKTENTVDDALVEAVRKALLGNGKSK